MPDPRDDPDTITYLATLAALENAGERTTLAIGPYSAFTIIGALQLALRHPQLGDVVRGIVGGDLRTLFDGTPGEALIRLGDDPANDIEEVPGGGS
jgi:hypothetical protein